MIIKILDRLRVPNVGEGIGVVKVQSQQAVQSRRIAIPDSQRVAELTHARSPGSAAIDDDMAPAKAKVIQQIAAQRSGPVAYGVDNRRRSSAVAKQRELVRGWIVLICPGV